MIESTHLIKRNQNIVVEATRDDFDSCHLPKMTHLSTKLTNESLPKMTHLSPEMPNGSSSLPNSGFDLKMIQLSPKMTNESSNLPNCGYDLNERYIVFKQKI